MAISREEEFELLPGKLLIVFAGTPIRWERQGDQYLDLLVFSTPASSAEDLVLLEQSGQARPTAALKPMSIHVAQRTAQKLDRQIEGMEFTVAVEMNPTGSVGLGRVNGVVELHHHPKENHWLLTLKGRAKARIGSWSTELGPDQIVIIPVGVKHTLERIGDEPLEFILFSTPPFVESDLVWD